MIYRAAPAAALLVEPLDAFTAVFHRASGVTHLLAAPAPEILVALADGPLSPEALLDVLARDYELIDPDRAALLARLDELVVAGLVEAELGAAA